MGITISILAINVTVISAGILIAWLGIIGTSFIISSILPIVSVLTAAGTVGVAGAGTAAGVSAGTVGVATVGATAGAAAAAGVSAGTVGVATAGAAVGATAGAGAVYSYNLYETDNYNKGFIQRLFEKYHPIQNIKSPIEIMDHISCCNICKILLLFLKKFIPPSKKDIYWKKITTNQKNILSKKYNYPWDDIRSVFFSGKNNID